jgi:signal transduction histidine kinase
MKRDHRIALLAVADAGLRHALIAQLLRMSDPPQVPIAAGLEQARLRAERLRPGVIVLDESCTSPVPLELAARELVRFAPVIALAEPSRQAELAALVEADEADLVAAVGSFLPVVAALVQRRLRSAEAPQGAFLGQQFEDAEEFAELLRHEVNNPLTGILGNAELLLARRDRLPAIAVQRLETIAELAVRLRETVRRLTEWLAGTHDQVRSA